MTQGDDATAGPETGETALGTIDENPADQRSMTEVKVEDPAPVKREEHRDPSLTLVIEQQTAKIPSHWFLVGAIGSMALSAGLEASGRQRLSRFVGFWPASLLTLGVYNKLVKLLGPR